MNSGRPLPRTAPSLKALGQSRFTTSKICSSRTPKRRAIEVARDHRRPSTLRPGSSPPVRSTVDVAAQVQRPEGLAQRAEAEGLAGEAVDHRATVMERCGPSLESSNDSKCDVRARCTACTVVFTGPVSRTARWPRWSLCRCSAHGTCGCCRRCCPLAALNCLI